MKIPRVTLPACLRCLALRRYKRITCKSRPARGRAGLRQRGYDNRFVGSVLSQLCHRGRGDGLFLWHRLEAEQPSTARQHTLNHSALLITVHPSPVLQGQRRRRTTAGLMPARPSMQRCCTVMRTRAGGSAPTYWGGPEHASLLALRQMMRGEWHHPPLLCCLAPDQRLAAPGWRPPPLWQDCSCCVGCQLSVAQGIWCAVPGL